jgi:hypothetical protein
MLTKVHYLLLLVLIVSSCGRTVKPTLAPETIYNSQGKKVIGSSFNNHLGTLSVLYGNEAAFQKAGQSSGNHAPGEVFTLVTWKQKPMPGWYGSDINGSMERIETVGVVRDGPGNTGYTYKLQEKGVNVPGHLVLNRQGRIDFIINHSASVFPDL